MTRQPIAWAAAVATLVIGGPVAADAPKEYVSTAETTTVLRDDLASIAGKEATILSARVKPGWVGDRHFHTGDVFVYVVKGSFTIDVEGEPRKTFTAGQVYHEALNTKMTARNLSTTEPAELLIFQVNDKGAPLMIRSE